MAITNNYTPVWPGGDSPADAATVAAYDALHNRTFTDPLLGLEAQREQTCGQPADEVAGLLPRHRLPGLAAGEAERLRVGDGT